MTLAVRTYGWLPTAAYGQPAGIVERALARR